MTSTGTVFRTAKTGLGVNVGTGCTLEVTSHDGQRTLSVSGYKAGILEAEIPIERLGESEIQDRGNNYITATFMGDQYFTRFELNDQLHGLGWKVIGYTMSHDANGMICSELWSKHIKGSKKH